jgi:hypothetical protein
VAGPFEHGNEGYYLKINTCSVLSTRPCALLLCVSSSLASVLRECVTQCIAVQNLGAPCYSVLSYTLFNFLLFKALNVGRDVINMRGLMQVI